MKKIFYIILFFATNFFYSQDNQFYENVGAKKVVINKKFISHVIFTYKIINGKKTEEKKIGPNSEIYHTIYINSDGDESTVRINTKNIMEEKKFHFGRIYKMNSDDFEIYQFVGINKCDATLMRPKGKVYGNGDQGITITCVDSNNDGTMVDFLLYKEL